jgi:hypothetical protein
MQGLEISFDRALRVWWRIVWRLVIVVGGFVLFTSAAETMANQTLGWSLPPASSHIAGYIFMSLLFSIMIVQRALRKKYRNFRIVLVPNSSS